MRRKIDTLPQDYLQIVRLRSSVPETHCVVGGILGGGKKNMISCLGNYGRNYGIVGTVIDEFMDLFDYEKFSNRLRNECIPLPVLCALQNKTIRGKIEPTLGEFKVSKNDYNQIVRLVTRSDEVEELRKDMLSLIVNSNLKLDNIFKENTTRRNLSVTLKVLEGLLCNMNEFTNQTI
jgi:geranylgeranyl pyrophosphate synthase